MLKWVARPSKVHVWETLMFIITNLTVEPYMYKADARGVSGSRSFSPLTKLLYLMSWQ